MPTTPTMILLCALVVAFAGPCDANNLARDDAKTVRPDQAANQLVGRVLVASAAGASLDTDLLRGGGSDDTLVLQRLLDRASDGRGLHLLVDGPALVSGLEVYGRTTIECTAGGGFYLKDRSAGAVIRNAHRSRNTVVDEHIQIRGCFINGNRNGQLPNGPPKSILRYVQEPDGTFRTGLQFFGVNYLSIEDVILWNARSFHSQIANAKFIRINNVLVDSNFPTFPGEGTLEEQKQYTAKYGINDDGLHFNGPIQYLTIDGLKVRTWDDGVSLAANDYGIDDITVGNEMGPYVGQGPITDVSISNVMVMDSHRGFRLLSSNQRIDRISIQGVTGTIRERFAVISHLEHPSLGDFGSITFSDVNVQCAPHPPWDELRADYYSTLTEEKRRWIPEEGELPLFALNSPIENLVLDKITTHAVDARPLIRVGIDASIDVMKVDLSVRDPEARAIPLKLLGRIGRMTLSLDWPGKIPIRREGGTIEQVRLSEWTDPAPQKGRSGE